MGQRSFELADFVPPEGPPRLMLEVMSWLRPGSGLEAGGDADDELRESVLSDAANGLAALGRDGAGDEVGGASPLPLPRILPPPSLRPDMARCRTGACCRAALD